MWGYLLLLFLDWSEFARHEGLGRWPNLGTVLESRTHLHDIRHNVVLSLAGVDLPVYEDKGRILKVMEFV